MGRTQEAMRIRTILTTHWQMALIGSRRPVKFPYRSSMIQHHDHTTTVICWFYNYRNLWTAPSAGDPSLSNGIGLRSIGILGRDTVTEINTSSKNRDNCSIIVKIAKLILIL